MSEHLPMSTIFNIKKHSLIDLAHSLNSASTRPVALSLYLKILKAEI